MKKTLSIAVTALAVASPAGQAAVSEAEFAELKAQFAAMSARLNTLEEENRALRELSNTTVTEVDLAKSEIAAVRKQSASASWADRVSWNGDFRYRYEEIDQQDRDERTRHRIRARAALIARLPSDVEVGLGMATGGDDPVSTNQTLGGGGSTKDLRLDLAYFKWNATDQLYLQAGKYKNPWQAPQKSALIFDGDFRPEGLSTGFANDHFFATVSGSWIESDSRSDDDFSYGLQAGTSFGPVSASIGYIDFPVAGREAIYDDSFFGNSTIGDRYLYDYELLTASAELVFELGEMPLSIYADYVNNQDADDLDTGYLAGVKLGKTKEKGSWQLQYQYQVLEADATLGLLTDSDFAGGGTDNKGHKISAKYAFTKAWTIGFTYFDTQRGVDLGDNEDYKRLMIDTAFKY